MLYKQLIHSNTEYRGKVGSPMRAPVPKAPARVRQRRKVFLHGGPYHGKSTRVDADGDGNTFVFTCRGMTGRYFNGYWFSV